MSDQINGHVDPAAWAELQRAEKANGVSFAGWTKDEVKLFLQTIGRYVEDRIKRATAPLLKRIEELEATGIKYVGTYQCAAEYKRGDVCNHEGGMWVATCAVPPQEVPGKSVCWQLSVKSSSTPRVPTQHGSLRPQQ